MKSLLLVLLFICSLVYADMTDIPSGSTGTGGSGASELSDLSDVNTLGAVNDNILTFQDGTWVDTFNTISILDDVTLTAPAAFDLLQLGSDGTWINIDELLYVNMIPTTDGTATYQEGRFFYDSTVKTYTGYNDILNTSIQFGRELRVRAFNDTAALLEDGMAVYISGVNTTPLLPEVSLADSSQYLTSRMIGVVTADCAIGAQCEVTRFGLVSDFDTSGLSIGPVYLDTTAGTLTSTKPILGAFVINIGYCLVSDAVNGAIAVDVSASELTVEVTDTNGFTTEQREDETTISFVDGTRTFTIAPTGSEFYYYINGEKYLESAAEDLVISDDEGLHVIYYDTDGALKEVVNPTGEQEQTIILKKAIVAELYWNTVDNVGEYLADERHDISMSPDTHAYLHRTRGAQWVSGLGLENFVIGSGALDTHAQFGSQLGTIFDEDLDSNPSAIGSTTGMDIYYIEGAAGDLRKTTNSGFSVLDDITAGIGATGRLVYNEFTGATWQLTVVPDNDFVICHVFATNFMDGSNPGTTVAVIGQASYGTVAAAEAGAATEANSILTGFEVEEAVLIASVILQTKNTYANAVKAKVVTTTEGANYLDWRQSDLAAGSAATSHNNLANLDLAQSTITWGHIDDQTQTIAGAKTLSSDITLEENLVLENDANTFSTTIKALDALLASYTLTLPPNDGDADQVLTTDGSGVLTWETPFEGEVLLTTVTSATTLTNADQTVLLENTAAITVTLPTAVSNSGRVFEISKTSGDGTAVTIDPNSTETIDGKTTVKMPSIKDRIKIISNGTNWNTLKDEIQIGAYATRQAPTGTLAASFNPVIFLTEAKDTHAAYNTSTGKYTIPISGWYSASIRVNINGSWVSGNIVVPRIYNDTTSTTIAEGGIKFQTTISSDFTSEVNGSFYAAEGDVISLDVYANGSTMSYSTSTVGSSFSITRE